MPSWQFSNSMGAALGVDCPEVALREQGKPEVFNSDVFTGDLEREDTAIGMGCRSRACDNIFCGAALEERQTRRRLAADQQCCVCNLAFAVARHRRESHAYFSHVVHDDAGVYKLFAQRKETPLSFDRRNKEGQLDGDWVPFFLVLQSVSALGKKKANP